jgi:hypothetical protein
MGYDVIKLNESAITREGLQNMDAVITGLRAYDCTSWLADKHSILMEYIQNGGNLIVQYNRNQGMIRLILDLSFCYF